MNSVILEGRWTKDIELKFVPGTGTAIANGILAVNRRFKQQGQPDADFIPIVIWKKQAESTANYCGAKGNRIIVRGNIQTRSYVNKEEKRVYVTEVIAEEVEFLESKRSSSNSNNSDNNPNSSFVPSDYGDDITPIDDGDIPF